jgi:hypothetical protein
LHSRLPKTRQGSPQAHIRSPYARMRHVTAAARRLGLHSATARTRTHARTFACLLPRLVAPWRIRHRVRYARQSRLSGHSGTHNIAAERGEGSRGRRGAGRGGEGRQSEQEGVLGRRQAQRLCCRITMSAPSTANATEYGTSRLSGPRANTVRRNTRTRPTRTRSAHLTPRLTITWCGYAACIVLASPRARRAIAETAALALAPSAADARREWSPLALSG